MVAVSFIVGIDPSLTCTGVAVANVEGGTIETTARLRTLPTARTPWAVHHRIRAQVLQVLRAAPPQVLLTVIESPSLRSRFGAHDERIALYWMLFDQMSGRGPVIPVGPKTRAKYAAADGNADKAAVLAAIRDKFPGLAVPDDNVADAIALASIGARLVGRPVDGDGLDQKRKAAFATVANVWDERE